MRHEILEAHIYVDGKTGCFAHSEEELNIASAVSFDFDRITLRIEDYKPTCISFCLNVSNACNLCCDYCFNDKKDGKGMPLDKALPYIDECFETFPNKEKYIVDLSGKGEPLLFLKTILEIKKHCDEWSNRLRKEVLVQFVSNGTLLTGNIAETLQNHGVLFGVSLDGAEYIHDKHRKDANGNPTYRTILQSVLAIPHHEYVGAACTLTKDVFSLNDSLTELSKVFNTVSYKPARDCTQAFDERSVDFWLESYDELLKALLEETLNGDLRRIKVLLNGEDYLGKFIHRAILNQRVVLRCDAGLSRFVLDSDGMVYACPASFGKEDFLVGKGSKIDLQKSADLFERRLNPKECAHCDFRHICGGECPLEKSLVGGVNKNMCRYKSHLILLAMHFALTLFKTNKQAFSQLQLFCREVDNRKKADEKLTKFLESHSELSFIEGKRIFDSSQKRY